MHSPDRETSDTRLEQAYSLLVAALNAEPAGGEARYLARLALLLLNELHYGERALSLIETARQARSPQER
jgi:hypothetical protein